MNQDHDLMNLCLWVEMENQDRKWVKQDEEDEQLIKKREQERRERIAANRAIATKNTQLAEQLK